MLASSRSTSLRPGHALALASLAGLGPGHTFRPGDELWALLDPPWWRLNPARPDYHPRTSAALLAGRGEIRNMPRHDIDGKPRARADIGAYVAVP